MMLRLLKKLSRKPLPHQLVEAVGEVLLDVHADQEAVVVLKKSVCFLPFCIIIEFALLCSLCTNYNCAHHVFFLIYYFYIKNKIIVLKYLYIIWFPVYLIHEKKSQIIFSSRQNRVVEVRVTSVHLSAFWNRHFFYTETKYFGLNITTN